MALRPRSITGIEVMSIAGVTCPHRRPPLDNSPGACVESIKRGVVVVPLTTEMSGWRRRGSVPSPKISNRQNFIARLTNTQANQTSRNSTDSQKASISPLKGNKRLWWWMMMVRSKKTEEILRSVGTSPLELIGHYSSLCGR